MLPPCDPKVSKRGRRLSQRPQMVVKRMAKWPHWSKRVSQRCERDSPNGAYMARQSHHPHHPTTKRKNKKRETHKMENAPYGINDFRGRDHQKRQPKASTSHTEVKGLQFLPNLAPKAAQVASGTGPGLVPGWRSLMYTYPLRRAWAPGGGENVDVPPVVQGFEAERFLVYFQHLSQKMES